MWFFRKIFDNLGKNVQNLKIFWKRAGDKTAGTVPGHIRILVEDKTNSRLENIQFYEILIKSFSTGYSSDSNTLFMIYKAKQYVISHFVLVYRSISKKSIKRKCKNWYKNKSRNVWVPLNFYYWFYLLKYHAWAWLL